MIVKLSSGRSNCPVLVVRRLGWMVHELDLMAGPLLSGRERGRRKGGGGRMQDGG